MFDDIIIIISLRMKIASFLAQLPLMYSGDISGEEIIGPNLDFALSPAWVTQSKYKLITISSRNM